MSIKRIILFIVGFFILNFGTALIIISNIGASPWDTVFVGLHMQMGFSVGTAVFVVQMILMFLISLIEREKPEWLAIIAILTSSLTLDFWLLVLSGFKPEGFILSMFFTTLGVMLQALGIVTYLKANLPKSQLDAIMLTVSKKLNWSLRLSRTVCESTAFLIGILLGGPFGIGTFIAILLLGPFIQFIKEALSNQSPEAIQPS